MKKQTENTTQTASPTGGEETVTQDVVTLNELQTENEQLKATIRLGAAHRQITGELAKAGARSPELLFDSVKADLQFAADGNLENAAALIERLKAAHPEQFGVERPVGSIDGGAGIATTPAIDQGGACKNETGRDRRSRLGRRAASFSRRLKLSTENEKRKTESEKNQYFPLSVFHFTFF